MHRNALRDPQIPPNAKHKLDATCPDALFVKSVPVPPEHEKSGVDVSRPGRTRMHYVTHRSHRMQKYMLGKMCFCTLLVQFVLVSPEHEK
jgi:hypothetical protein